MYKIDSTVAIFVSCDMIFRPPNLLKLSKNIYQKSPPVVRFLQASFFHDTNSFQIQHWLSFTEYINVHCTCRWKYMYSNVLVNILNCIYCTLIANFMWHEESLRDSEEEAVVVQYCMLSLFLAHCWDQNCSTVCQNKCGQIKSLLSLTWQSTLLWMVYTGEFWRLIRWASLTQLALLSVIACIWRC